MNTTIPVSTFACQWSKGTTRRTDIVRVADTTMRREMQIKPTMRHHLTSVRMATNKQTKKEVSVDEDMEKWILCVLLFKM